MRSIRYLAPETPSGARYGCGGTVLAVTIDAPEAGLTIEEERALRKEQVAQGYRLFASYGWGDDGAGHITARDPELTDHMWLLAGGVAFRDATPDKLVLISPDATVVEGAGGAGYGGAKRDERGFNITAYNIHHPLHVQRPDVVSAVHTHTGYGTPLSALCEPLRMTSQEACSFYGKQALYLGEDVDVREPAGGYRIADELGDGRLIFLGNHGMLTVGTSVASAVGFFYIAERAAEVQMKAPAARVISDEGAAASHAGVGQEETGKLVFDYLIASRL